MNRYSGHGTFLENEEQEIIDIRRTALLSHFGGLHFGDGA